MDDNLSELANPGKAGDCLLDRLRNSGQIYTFAGRHSVVALNPLNCFFDHRKTTSPSTSKRRETLSDFQHLYTNEVIRDYSNLNRMQTKPPHIFSLASRALHAKKSLIIATGDSGSGKTISNDHLIRYYTIISSSTSSIARDLSEMNAILEYFGNASTSLNENSSRFCKVIRLQFAPASASHTPHLASASIESCFLEKTRISEPSSLSPFHALRFEDDEAFREIQCKLGRLNFDENELNGLNRILRCVKRLRDFEVEKESLKDMLSDCCELMEWRSDAATATGCRIGVDEVVKRFTTSRIAVRKRLTAYERVMTGDEQRTVRQVVAREMYVRLFDTLVRRFNKILCRNNADESANEAEVALIDMFGFENFIESPNNFEQLCINYVNESIQAFFRQQFITAIEEDLMDGGREAPPDVEKAIAIERCVFRVIDEAVALKQSTNEMARRLEEDVSSDGVIGKSHERGSFVIRHYAGDVRYSFRQILEKNRDSVPQNVTELLAMSASPIITAFLSVTSKEDKENQPRRAAERTVLKKCQNRMRRLVDEMRSSIDSIYFIRCIRTDSKDIFEAQLQHAGVVEAAMMARKVFGVRISREEFVTQYAHLLSREKQQIPVDMADLLGLLGTSTGVSIGNRFVYLADEHLSHLNALITLLKTRCALKIQSFWRLHRKQPAESVSTVADHNSPLSFSTFDGVIPRGGVGPSTRIASRHFRAVSNHILPNAHRINEACSITDALS